MMQASDNDAAIPLHFVPEAVRKAFEVETASFADDLSARERVIGYVLDCALNLREEIEAKMLLLRLVVVERFRDVGLSEPSEANGVAQGCSRRARIRRLTSDQGEAVFLSLSRVFNRSRIVCSVP